ncbi:ribonuclease T2 [Punctularia strigosozonata HHB-11173 SS5]|uniref:ribonuclease T2 n=1 Tax=Punctularia strigosozonata (strain HHB-11173) TaxID=741275 RepID=UPI0004418310|nr:ribonuclease T2 [Punctularia strigosozonata HHB-11173 SS5]EIN14436.1 ribonuclease T2 [Punctularia strigosozonata HHB-11173 SS5]
MSSSNHPVTGLPERIHDRHHRATGPGIRFQQPGLSGLADSSSECPDPPVLSCSSAADSTDSCCVVKPGGVLVHTQFWDLDEGLSDSWGIHGLWPDECNGATYENCDSSRAYSGSQIVEALSNAGLQSTLDFMDTYWVSNDESPENFWAHEWSTHGTCVSTLEPSCFNNYQTAQETTLYFSTIVSLFQQLNTFDALQHAGVTPSDSKTYMYAELTTAVKSATGYTVDFVCTGSGKTISQIQYYLLAEGPLQHGSFVESNPTRRGTCDSSGLRYPVKTTGGNGDEDNTESHVPHGRRRQRHGSWRDRRHH